MIDETLHRVIAANIGNVVEWFDFAVFGFLAPEFGRLFFAADDKRTAMMKTFGVFGGAFVMRPFGGVMFGYLGDTMGRKVALEVSLALMSVSMIGLCILPTYESVGVLAPVLLVIVRLCQGLSVGGQIVGAMIFTVEGAPLHRRGVFGACCMGTAVLGTAIGSAVVPILHMLEPEQLDSWGWRLPFVAGTVLGLVGICVQKGSTESPEFLAMQEQKKEEEERAAAIAEKTKDKSPLTVAFEENMYEMVTVMLVAAVWCSGFYMGYVWLPSYTADLAENKTPHAFLANTLCLFILTAMFPLYGMLADTYGFSLVMSYGCWGMALMTPFCFYLCSLGQFQATVAGQILFGANLAAVGATLPAWMVSSFSTEVRYTAVAVGFNLAQAIYAGSAPVLASFLEQATKSVIPPALWLSTVALIAAATVSVLRSRKEFEELEDEVAAAKKAQKEARLEEKEGRQSRAAAGMGAAQEDINREYNGGSNGEKQSLLASSDHGADSI